MIQSRLAAGLIAAMAFATTAIAEDRVRLNRMNEVLSEGKAAFGTFVRFRDADGAAYYAAAELDFVLFDMEHGPADFNQFRTFLQFMIDRARLLKKNTLQLDVTPLARVPGNGIEKNQWVVKQVLDAGAFGVMTPHIATVDEGLAAITATRYPQAVGAADFEPAGERGVAPGNPARYWGLPVAQYMARADIWPLDPQGELSLVIMIEDRLGVKNVRDILRATKGVTAVFIGPFDLSTSLGYPAQPDHPETENAIQTVLAACKEFAVPCGILVFKNNIEKRVAEGFRWLVIAGSPGEIEEAVRIGKRAAGR